MTDIKELLKEFERFAYDTSMHTAFTNMLDWVLLPFKKHDTASEQQVALDATATIPK